MTSNENDLDRKSKQAMDFYRQGKFPEAVELFSWLHQEFSASGNNVKADEMANNLAVTFLDQNDPEQAIDLIEGTPQRFFEAGETIMAAQAYGNLGAAMAAANRLEEAENAYRQSMQIFRQQGHDEGVTFVGQALSQLQLKQGKTLEALASMEASLEGQKKPGLRQRLLRKLLKLPFRLTGGR